MVGGGIIGLSIGWRLAARGVEVQVFDAWAAGGSVLPMGKQSEALPMGKQSKAGAWFVAAGMLAAGNESTWESAALGELMVESARRWPGFAAELGVELPDAGTLVVALTADDVAEAEREWARRPGHRPSPDPHSGQRPGPHSGQRPGPHPGQRPGPHPGPHPGQRPGPPPGGMVAAGELGGAAAGQRLLEVSRAKHLGPSALREAEPALSPRVRAGCHLPEDRQVDPRKVVAALRERVLVVPEKVDDLADLDADQVVVAAGVGTARLAGLPVRPVKGELLRLRGEPGLLRHVISGYADGRRVYLVPRADGEIVVGATQDERTDDVVTAGAVLELLRAATDLVPALADCAITETLVGHRPSTPDNAPLLGRLDGRTVIASGHHRNGVLLAPVTADLIADLIVTGEPDPLLAPFAPGRFT
ncbi:hypothetical protein Acsp02_35880 [Actinoplanes sp. NBRC 103695]|nr:hypothetical protein Acsp02_35880 [Actinoplanes sp. NBRC 103695]